MSGVSELIRAIQKVADKSPKQNVKVLECEVVSVNIEEKTCVVKSVSIEDTEISEVKMQATNNDGFCLVPAIESMVVVSVTKTKEPFIILTSDIDKILCVIDGNNFYTFDSEGFVFNNGLNGGLVVSKNIIEKINTIEKSINDLKFILSTWVPVPSDGGAALKALLSSYYMPLVLSNKIEIENKKIKH
jgi:hypothetical protein